MDKTVKRYTRMYVKGLRARRMPDADAKGEAYRRRLSSMYSSEAFKRHSIYPTMDVKLIYAVIAMCLELREHGLFDSEIIDFPNAVFKTRRRVFAVMERCICLLPNCWRIVENWNVSDHAKRVQDGSIKYDLFQVSPGKVEYSISGCMYVEMFEYYNIRGLCKIFCKTDEFAYANLSSRVRFIRHSDLSDGACCHDEIIKREA